jgi:CBS domain containing-hemolysin-like protein
MPAVPVSVWEQIPVVVIFTLLLCALGLAMFKAFREAITDINEHYLEIVEQSNARHADSLRENNEQWQLYFNARSETTQMVNSQVVEKLEKLTAIIQKLVGDFDSHDRMERLALEEIPTRRHTNRSAK